LYFLEDISGYFVVLRTEDTACKSFGISTTHSKYKKVYKQKLSFFKASYMCTSFSQIRLSFLSPGDTVITPTTFRKTKLW